MARQREQARAASKFVMKGALEYSGPATAFHGYETLVPKAPSSPSTRTAPR
jgi:alanyl-tRNA synthetase